MKYVAGPRAALKSAGSGSTRIGLFESEHADAFAVTGRAIANYLSRSKIEPPPAAVDFLSIALAAVAVDGIAIRRMSPDGWTREIELGVALQQPDLWAEMENEVASALMFLTTDRWATNFFSGGMEFASPPKPARLDGDSALLLSGGLDSLVGAIDLVAGGRRPVGVSRTDRGAGAAQSAFARGVGGPPLVHMQLSDNLRSSGAARETSQRSRSMLFIALGVLAATSTSDYANGAHVPLYACENGFIALNPPLTGSRIGSLSTRTTHPEFIARLQSIFDAAGLRVTIENPYIEMTKGEMLERCSGQGALLQHAATSVSCGRYQRFGYTHCGRCLPCQIRRASYLRWGQVDPTPYVYSDLSRPDYDHQWFRDVRAVQVAVARIEAEGLERWLGSTLMTPAIVEVDALGAMLGRGVEELAALHRALGAV